MAQIPQPHASTPRASHSARGELHNQPLHSYESNGLWMVERVEDALEPLLEITGVDTENGETLIHGRPRAGAGQRFSAVARTLAERGFDVRLLDISEDRAAVAVSPLAPTRRVAIRPAVSGLLLLLTLLTMSGAGAWQLGIDLIAEPGRWLEGWPYALALIPILLVHEAGHFLMARHRGTLLSLPYFIPAPLSLGTFGAVVRMDRRVADRATYFDVAAAGPLAGLLVAVAALAFGFASTESDAMHGVNPGSSILLVVLFKFFGNGVPDHAVVFGPLGLAGWFGLVITALNLLPIGGLDGGHMAYAVLGRRRAATLSAVCIGLLVAAGFFYHRHLLVWAFVAWSVGGLHHPAARNELAPIGPVRGMIAVAAAALTLLITLPWPAGA